MPIKIVGIENENNYDIFHWDLIILKNEKKKRMLQSNY